jgi:uncharacterized protein YndB with AHSA1/START domain
MEYGSIERELRIDATPEVVYEVISSPEHLREWCDHLRRPDGTRRGDCAAHCLGG